MRRRSTLGSGRRRRWRARAVSSCSGWRNRKASTRYLTSAGTPGPRRTSANDRRCASPVVERERGAATRRAGRWAGSRYAHLMRPSFELGTLGALIMTVLSAGAGGLACGSSPAPKGRTSSPSHADLCAGAAPESSDHLVTAISCPFVQHTSNIEKFGEPLTEARDLLDGAGVKVATITNTCDQWALGTDAQGLAVVVRLDSGRVISHGTEHVGQGLSRLPATLSLPVRLR